MSKHNCEKIFDFGSLVNLCRQTHEAIQGRAARAVDTNLATRNWLFGWYIVEYEQNGADRAEYGKQALKKLSTALQDTIGRGFSVDSLEKMRLFYLEYRHLQLDGKKSETASRILGKGQTPSDQSSASRNMLRINGMEIQQTLSVELIGHLRLGWSQLFRPACETGRRITDGGHCPVPPQKRRISEVDASIEHQNLCLEISALSALQRRTEKPTRIGEEIF